GSPWDAGRNPLWPFPASNGLRPIADAEAVEYRSGDLPNFHAHQLRDVIGAVREKRSPAVTGVDGRRVVAIIQGVYESGRTGRPGKLNDWSRAHRHGWAAPSACPGRMAR